MSNQDNESKKAKRPYEPPRIFDLSGSVAYAGSSCSPGGSAAGKCQPGTVATGGKCQPGDSASNGKCQPGNFAQPGKCQPGNQAEEGGTPSGGGKKCQPGGIASGGKCQPGNLAGGGKCRPGNSASAKCQPGGNPSSSDKDSDKDTDKGSDKDTDKGSDKGKGKGRNAKPIAAAPDAPGLAQNAPNPFNPSTTISFDLPAAGYAQVEIFDVLGQQVRVLVDGELGAGFHRMEWDGRNSAGEAVANGVYLCRLTSTGRKLVQRMMLLK